MIKVMKDNHLEEKLSRHLKGKNPGHFRMMLGQALRGMVGRKTPVKIKGQTISRLNQKVELMRGLEEEKITPRAVKNRKKKN